MRDDAPTGPLTQASAPQAPGRLGREDARNFRGGPLSYAGAGLDPVAPLFGNERLDQVVD